MTLYVTVGVAGVGKSTMINKSMDVQDGTMKVFSSDQYRMNLYGSLSEGNKHNDKVFNQLYKDLTDWLKDGHDAVLDATNLPRKSRVAIYDRFHRYTNVVIGYFLKPKAMIKEQNNQRVGDKKVPDYVINRMYLDQQIPKVGVDCDDFEVIGPDFLKESVDLNKINTIEELQEYVSPVWRDEFDKNFAPHESPYHKESINDHINMTVADANETHPELHTVALLHDLGKGISKQLDERHIARYRGHDNVGANYALLIERQLHDYRDVPNHDVSESIFQHMRAHRGISKKVINREHLTDKDLKRFADFAEIDKRARKL